MHKQLAALEKQEKVYGIVTQNLDCLHTIAGSENVIEFQGSFRDNICIDCNSRFYDYKVWGQGHMPRCEVCGGYLMPTSFCRESPIHSIASRENMNNAINMISKADLVIVIGTTGFRSEEYLSRMQSKTKLEQINPSPTQFDNITTLNIRADAAEVLEKILKG